MKSIIKIRVNDYAKKHVIRTIDDCIRGGVYFVKEDIWIENEYGPGIKYTPRTILCLGKDFVDGVLFRAGGYVIIESELLNWSSFDSRFK